MSQPREVEAIVGSADSERPFDELTPSEKRARLAVVLERGLTSDRLIVPLPNDLHGEWVVNDPMEIARMQSMGFKVDTEYATKRAMHLGGASEAKIGDVIFMTAPVEVKQMIDEIRQKKFNEVHGKKRIGNRSVQREEAEAINSAALPIVSESEESAVNAAQIREAISQQVT